MHKELFEETVSRCLEEAGRNRVVVNGPEIRLFDRPLFGYSDAADPLFAGLKDPAAIGPHFRCPKEWLPAAVTVISMFLPFSEQVRRSNAAQDRFPSIEWLYGRIEGQQMVAALGEYAAELLRNEGHEAIVPVLSAEFMTESLPAEKRFTSNWSERHVAFVSGLGTFGLSKGLITERGMAGRFISVVTDGAFAPSERRYTELYEWCTRCGACAGRCPGGAITPESGKDHLKCYQYQQSFIETVAPRYGCGLCQTGVPCEAGRPGGR